MKTNIKLWTMGLMTAALLGNTACTDLLHESYGQVVSEDYVPKTEEDVSYLVNAAYIPWRETLLQWNGVVRAQELCADLSLAFAQKKMPVTQIFVNKATLEDIFLELTEDNPEEKSSKKSFKKTSKKLFKRKNGGEK